MSLERSIPFSRDYQNAKQFLLKRKTTEVYEGEFERDNTFYDEQRTKAGIRIFSFALAIRNRAVIARHSPS
jgi:hypothetical protein